MIVKYRGIAAEELPEDHQWCWIGGVDRVETMGRDVDCSGGIARECFRIGITVGTATKETMTVLWLHHTDGGLPTHLALGTSEAFLLNDDGKTIDRLR